MRNSRSFRFAFALFSIVWTAVAAFLIAFFVPDIVQDNIVVNKGEKIEAIVTGAYEDTSYTENGKHYWYMTYQYEYEGQTFKGETSSSYDRNEVLSKGAVISILYYNGRTVQDGYSISNGSIFIRIFIVISLGVGIGMGVAAIKSGSKDRKMDKIKTTGTRTKATYVTSYSNLRVNNVPYYKVKYKYKDGYGIERTEESLGYCMRDEAEYLEALTEFEIAYADGLSVIVEDLIDRKSLDEILNRHSMESVEPIEAGDAENAILPNTQYQCPSCGAISIPTADGTCQYCGTQINNK